jgi:hypothetical protein
MINCPDCNHPLSMPYLSGKEGWCEKCKRHVGEGAESFTHEGADASIDDLLQELGFRDWAEQSIWTKEYALYHFTFQFGEAGTERDVDTWDFKVEVTGTQLTVLKCQSRLFTDCLLRYFLFMQLLEKM